MSQLQTVTLTSLPTDKCSFGCAVLDEFLAEGIPCGTITELAGESTVAKSQTCMQLLLQSQLPKALGGLSGSAVYVYTEGEPSIKRLQEMASHLKYKHPPEALLDIPDPLANIYIEKGFDNGQDLLSCLHRVRRLLQQPGVRPVRLIVVDSIAHLFRDLGDNAGVEELASRTEMLFRIAAMLKRYAHDYNLAVVVTNQVTDVVKEECGDTEAARFARWSSCGTGAGHTSNMQLVSSGREVLPALGLAWANCVNTRLFLSRYSYSGTSTPVHLDIPPSKAELAAQAVGALSTTGGQRLLRVMEIVFSPHLPHGEYCFYVLEPSGLTGLHPDLHPNLYATDYIFGYTPGRAGNAVQQQVAITAQQAQEQGALAQHSQQSSVAGKHLQQQQQQSIPFQGGQQDGQRPQQVRRLNPADSHQVAADPAQQQQLGRGHHPGMASTGEDCTPQQQHHLQQLRYHPQHRQQQVYPSLSLPQLQQLPDSSRCNNKTVVYQKNDAGNGQSYRAIHTPQTTNFSSYELRQHEAPITSRAGVRQDQPTAPQTGQNLQPLPPQQPQLTLQQHHHLRHIYHAQQPQQLQQQSQSYAQSQPGRAQQLTEHPGHPPYPGCEQQEADNHRGPPQGARPLQQQRIGKEVLQGPLSLMYSICGGQQQPQSVVEKQHSAQQSRLSGSSHSTKTSSVRHAPAQGIQQELQQGRPCTVSGRILQADGPSSQPCSGRDSGRLRQQQQKASRYGVVPLVLSQHSSQSTKAGC